MRPTDASRFLERAADRPWSWQADNCLLLICDWVDGRRGTALAAEWRAKALDERAARRAMAEAGGPVAFVAREAARAGCVRIDPADALDGDIGLVPVTAMLESAKQRPEGEEPRRRLVTFPVGALRCGSFWGARMKDGVFVGPGDALAAWRV